MEKEKRFLTWIKPLNLVLTYLVVYIHTYNASAYNLEYEGFGGFVLIIEDIIAQNIAHIAVPMFFFISGYLFYRNASKENFLEKIKRRIKSLLVPYMLWNSLYFLTFLTISSIPFLAQYLNSMQVEFSVENLFKGVFLYEYNYIMWYIYQLMLFVLFSPLIIVLIEKLYFMVILLIILCVVYSLGILEIPCLSNIGFAYGIYPDMFLYYLLGACFSRHYFVRKESHRFVPIALIIFGQIVWVFNKSEYKEWKYNFMNLLFIILTILGIYLLLCKIKKSFYINKGLEVLYQHTFIVFAAHPFIVELVQKIMYIALGNSTVSALIDFVVSPLITIAICNVTGIILKRLVPRTYNLLVGGR